MTEAKADLPTSDSSRNPANPAAALPVGEKAAAGAAWLLLQTVAARFMTLGVNIVLSRWLLRPEDFAQVAMAQSVCTVFALAQPSNLGDVLIQRQRRFQRWANSGFWLSAAAGAAILVTALALAPISGWIFKSRVVPWLVVVAGATTATSSLGVVFQARLSIGFHFRRIAAIATAAAVLSSILMLALGWLGCGPFSLTIPGIAAGALTVALYARTSDFRPHMAIHLARWGELLKNVGILSLAGFFSLITLQADNFCLGIYRKSELGNYAWAYSLSFQFAQLAGGSLRSAMLPAMSNISGDRQRLETALRRAVSLIALICMPTCVLMVPAMPAVVRAVFSAKWDASVEYVQIFLPSMGWMVVSTVLWTTMQSRGFYKRCLVTWAIIAAAFVACVWPAAALGGARQVACAVSLVYGTSTLLHIVMATVGSDWRHRAGILAAAAIPFALAAGSALVAWYACSRIPLDAHDWRIGGLSLVIGGLLYVLLCRILCKQEMRLAAERLGALAGRFRRSAKKH